MEENCDILMEFLNEILMEFYWKIPIKFHKNVNFSR